MSHEPQKNPEVKKEGARPPEKKERKIVRTDQTLPAWIWISFTAIFLLFIARSCREKSKEEKGAEAQARAEQRAASAIKTSSPTTMTKALVLRFDGFTRCEPNIDYEFELDTQGDPITMQFPGIPEPVAYSGKEVLVAPTNRLSGPVIIMSSDPSKQARVRIWEVQYIKGY